MTGNSVNEPLTDDPAFPKVENAEYIAFVRRTLRALRRRVGSSDPESLRQMVQLAQDLDDAIVGAVAVLKRDYSWSEIARALGVSKQAAEQRYGTRIRAKGETRDR